ncbi:hypothetical protein DUI87_31839 [Hirundo rustica rustica]|uniref:Arf-GAP with coiled-coil, ANK repeat and PH domain-containing protein n=1 Tax=Hirundo rustica rustica TaxID=333673 RepID=A0A3M0IUP5_HIRRU|nr:hypothetical protein DUI87_31839 [Hirundo rustica rustica]
MTVEFEECIKDSPRFRATIDEVETDVVEIEAKLDKLVKLCSGMIEAGKVYITTNKHFVSGVRDLSQQCRKDEMISECLDKFGDSLQEMINYHMILFDQAQSFLSFPFHVSCVGWEQNQDLPAGLILQDKPIPKSICRTNPSQNPSAGLILQDKPIPKSICRTNPSQNPSAGETHPKIHLQGRQIPKSICRADRSQNPSAGQTHPKIHLQDKPIPKSTCRADPAGETHPKIPAGQTDPKIHLQEKPIPKFTCRTNPSQNPPAGQTDPKIHLQDRQIPKSSAGLILQNNQIPKSICRADPAG